MIAELAAGAACALLAGVPAREDQMVQTRQYVYKQTPQGALSVHLDLPPGWSPDDRRPAIVLFFGGGWTDGSPHHFARQAARFAARGMVAARPDYRTRSRHDTTPLDAVEDARSAMRWLRANAARFGVDAQRIAAGGGSAGGHLAACAYAAADVNAPDDDLSVSPVPDLLVLFNPVMNTHALRQAGFFAGMRPQDVMRISPVQHLAADAPAAIMFYGTEDPLLGGGREWVEKAAEVGVETELWTAKGQGHGFFNSSPWLEASLRLADQFLVRHGYLEGGPAVEAPEGGRMEKAASSP